MAAAFGAVNLDPGHEEGPVGGRRHRLIERLEEARPAGAAVELGRRFEKRLAAARTGEHAVALFLVERAGAGALGTVLAQHVVGLGAQLRLPFGVAESYREILSLGRRH